jgi:hypothetical protein
MLPLAPDTPTMILGIGQSLPKCHPEPVEGQPQSALRPLDLVNHECRSWLPLDKIGVTWFQERHPAG